MVADKSVIAEQLEEEIKKEAGKLLKSIHLYDVYIPEEDAADKISYTFSLEFSSSERTLTDEEINRVQEKIIKHLYKKLNAELRT